MIGSTISHYKIIEKLGEGGMGVVYKAHDLKLDRDVALKFLPHHLTATPEEQSRFLQEARAASALNHPNICAIHSIGEEGDPKGAGQQFIEMEYVDGKTLREIIQSALPTQQSAITYAIQIGEALREAHSKGIVHRDVKTDNIMVNTKNQVKIMDFGLAKLKGSMKLTKTSSTVGTLSYMAPEQIQGGEIDGRSDIFSFGVVLYEMLTGHMPFRGEHEAAIIYSIVNEEPLPLQKYLQDIPSELVHILNRALEKDPEDRYQSVHDMVIDLRRLKKETSRVSRAAAVVTPHGGVVETSEGPPKPWFHKSYLFAPRPVVVGLIAVVIMLIAGISYFLFFHSKERFVQNRLAVAGFENRTGDSSLDAIGIQIIESIAQGIAGIGIIEVVPSDDGIRIWQRLRLESLRPDLLPLFAEETGARLIVGGMYYKQGDSLFIHARLIDSESAKHLKVVQQIGSTLENSRIAIEKVRQRLMGAVAFLSDVNAPFYAENPAYFPTYESYKEFKTGCDLFYRGKYSASINYLSESFRLDPNFKIPLILQAYGFINAGNARAGDSLFQYLDKLRPTLVKPDLLMLNHLNGWLRGDILTCLDASRGMARLAPAWSGIRYQWGLDALRTNRPREAITALSTWVKWDTTSLRDWIPFWDVKTFAFHLLNEHEQELEEAQKGRQLLVNRIQTIWYEMRALAALGRIEEIWKRCDEVYAFPRGDEGSPAGIFISCALELRYHGFIEAYRQAAKKSIDWYTARPDSEQQLQTNISGLAYAYYAAERWDESGEIYQKLLKENPDNLTYLGRSGVIAARMNDIVEVRRIDEILRKTNRPYINGIHILWRARIASLLGKKELAVLLLREALSRGQYFYRLHADMDLEPLREYPPFQELVKPKE
jgi:serine/threonine protein kinase/tetratricopeptide (TPR) repeat protein